jgi:translation initiation factor 2B subunit (eIF-2B alpha/beta/delta family)
MTPELEKRIALLASDRESGASEIVDDAVSILRSALRSGDPVLAVARAVCRAQPSMAPVWNAAIAALGSAEDSGRFDRFVERVSRAPEALLRFAVECFETGGSKRAPLRVVTVSFSRTVAMVMERLAQSRRLRVSCSESRPALEGRTLAARLVSAGVAVTCFADAALGHALGGADAVVVGADAVAPEWFLNKSGTRMLAAAAAQQGVPVYVLASRDKFVNHAVAGRLVIREGGASEIWEAPPPGVIVRNPYFEPTPLDLVTSVISDAGILGAGMVPDVCEAVGREIPASLIDCL